MIIESAEYLQYLDSFLTENDKKYIDDIDVARKVVSYGFRGQVEMPLEPKTKQLLKTKIFLKNDVLSVACSEREEEINDGKLDSVLFLKYKGKSAYIDLRDRIELESGTLKPLKSDLAFMNWKSRFTIYKDTRSFQVVITDDSFSLRHTVKRYVIVPGLGGEYVKRQEIKVEGYEKIVFYDMRHNY